MKISNVTEVEINRALEMANEYFKGNLSFNRFERKGNGYQVTLKTNGYDKPGYRHGYSGRRMPSACWHAYGAFIDAIFEIQSNAKVHNLRTGKMDTEDSWYWHDWNIGSIFQPLMYSDACDCWDLGYDGPSG